MSIAAWLWLTQSLYAQSSDPKTYHLSALRVEGQRQLTAEAVRNMSGLQTGESVSVPSDISQAISSPVEAGFVCGCQHPPG